MRLYQKQNLILLKKRFSPNIFIDISKYLDKKIEIMNMYKSEVSNFPFPRSEKSIRALAYYVVVNAGLKLQSLLS